MALSKIAQRTAAAASGETVAIITLTGDIASTSKDALLEAYGKVDPAVKKVLLEFSSVDYINSSGIAIIIQLLLQASKGAQHTIALAGLSAHFTKVFTMVGVPKYATIYTDEMAALAVL